MTPLSFRHLFFRGALAALILIATPAHADQTNKAPVTAIVGGTIVPMTGDPIMGGTLIFRGDEILAVGRNIAPPKGAHIIDATGKWVTPGLIAPFSRLGLVEVDGVKETNDSAAPESPFGAALDVSHAYNPRSVHVAINRRAGVTRAIVAPQAGGSIFGGQGAIVSLAAPHPGTRTITHPRAFQYAIFGEQGAKVAGGARSAAFASLLTGLRTAQQQARNPKRMAGEQRNALVTRPDALALVPIVAGKMPLLIHADRASDIERLLELRDEFPRLRLVIVGGREAWMLADRLAQTGTPVITSALFNRPEYFETLAATRSNAGRLVQAGVPVAISLIGWRDARQLRLLPQQVGNLVGLQRVPGAVGLTHEQALATITRTPAQIFGLDDLGVLAKGKRADLVIWDGDPLEAASAPTMVFIDGVRQSLESRQTRLRDRYAPDRPRDLPEQYRH